MFAGIVVDEADRDAEVGVEPKLADDHLPARSGADHQHLLAAAGTEPPRSPLEEEAHARAGADEKDRRQDQVEDEDRSRERVGVGLGEHPDGEQRRSAEDGSADDRPAVAEVEVTPPLRMDRGELEDQALSEPDQRRRDEHLAITIGHPVGRIEKAQLERQVEGGGSEKAVRRYLCEPVAEDRSAKAVHRAMVDQQGGSPQVD